LIVTHDVFSISSVKVFMTHGWVPAVLLPYPAHGCGCSRSQDSKINGRRTVRIRPIDSKRPIIARETCGWKNKSISSLNPPKSQAELVESATAVEGGGLRYTNIDQGPFLIAARRSY
jgi:hypothetical protein